MYTPRGPRHRRINQSVWPCLCRGWAFLFHSTAIPCRWTGVYGVPRKVCIINVVHYQFLKFPECRNRLRSVCSKGLFDGWQALKVFSMHELPDDRASRKKTISSFFGILSAVTACLQRCENCQMYVLMLTPGDVDIVGQLPRVLKFFNSVSFGYDLWSCKEMYE